MARLKILWTSTALKQRNHIFKYWNERNKSNSYSKKLKNKITDINIIITGFWDNRQNPEMLLTFLKQQ